MDNKENEINIIYLGVVSSFNVQKSEITISDSPIELKNIKHEIPVYIGYTKNFMQNFQAKEIIFYKKYAKLLFAETLSAEKIKSLVRMAVFIQENDLKKSNPKMILPEEVMNFEVYDIAKGELIGIIQDVQINPANQVWIVENDEYELPIPFSENVVKKIDLKKKQIFIDLIDGIMDLAIFKLKNKQQKSIKRRRIFDE
jgi:16S rRNA processing protein RimM